MLSGCHRVFGRHEIRLMRDQLLLSFTAELFVVQDMEGQRFEIALKVVFTQRD